MRFAHALVCSTLALPLMVACGEENQPVDAQTILSDTQTRLNGLSGSTSSLIKKSKWTQDLLEANPEDVSQAAQQGEDLVKQLTDQLFKAEYIEDEQSDQITLRIPGTLLCGELAGQTMADPQCLAEVEKYPLRLVLSQPSGQEIVIEVKIGVMPIEVLQLELSPNEVAISGDLARLKALAESITGEAAPGTIEGQWEVRLAVSSDGQQVVLSNSLENFKAEGDVEGQSVLMELKKASISLGLNGEYPEISIETGKGKVEIPAELVFEESQLQGMLKLSTPEIVSTMKQLAGSEAVQIKGSIKGDLELQLADEQLLLVSTNHNNGQELVMNLSMGAEGPQVEYRSSSEDMIRWVDKTKLTQLAELL